jgi:signal transduction histidine kinase/CheY-like chemotaxis protein
VILIGLVLSLLGSLTRLYILDRYMRHTALATVEEQQQSFSKHVANAILQKIALRQDTLQRLAQGLAPSLLHHPDALQAWVTERYAMLPFFAAGLTVVSADGHILAQFPDSHTLAPGAQVDVGVGARILADGEGAAIRLTQPIGGPGGAPIAYLQGNTRLIDPYFLNRLDVDRNGLHGGYSVVFLHDQLVLQASDADMVLHDYAARDGSPLLDRAIAAASDTSDPRNIVDGDAIWARTLLPNTGWVVVAYLPTSEAMAIVQSTRDLVFHSIPGIFLLYFVLAGSGVYFTLRPLRRAAEHADRMTRGECPLESLPILYDDELGDMTAAFNRLLKKLDENSQELLAQKEIAEESALSKSRFLAAASHDLRQPMHALSLYLGVLAHYELPLAAQPVMDHVRICAQTMDEMFRAMLDLSRLDAQVTQAEFSVFPIADVLKKIHIEFAQQAQAKGLQLHSFGGSAYVRSDSELLERMLRNLVANAVRYTTQGKILMGCRRVGGAIQIGVYDTGPGIAPDQQHLVFEEFYQVGNPMRDRSQGLGLGLAIVQRLARLLDTPLRLVSQPGRGSVFLLTVPTARIPLKELESQRAERSSLDGTPKGIFVALVDDEKLILDATQLLLEHWGCSVMSAASGRSLAAQLAQCARVPDVIISDYRLQDSENGYDVIQLLRSEFNQDIPAILVTGDTSPQRIQAMQSTGLQILHKPVAEPVLREALQSLLAKAVVSPMVHLDHFGLHTTDDLISFRR